MKTYIIISTIIAIAIILIASFDFVYLLMGVCLIACLRLSYELKPEIWKTFAKKNDDILWNVEMWMRSFSK